MFPAAEGKEQEKTSSHETQNFTVSSPTVQLPKGGGAIRGIGEKFAANPVTGTGSMTVPIATSPGRSGFGPQLSLSYDSGAGNGPFGCGWSLSLPAITRKTDKGLPQYRDAQESDVYILSGAEDLVPSLLQDDQGKWGTDEFERDGYKVKRYRPRIEGLFARIERWTKKDSGEIHWRSISRDNITTIYGKTNNSRIYDPNDIDPQHPTRIFSWLSCESYDDKGNAIVYEYLREDSQRIFEDQRGQRVALAHEQNRNDTTRSANCYLKCIKYGNRLPNRDATTWQATDPTQLPNDTWMFEVVFDYDQGYYAEDEPDAQGSIFIQALIDPPAGSNWSIRQDPFSTYRAGFEVRTYRLCRRVLMFHHFPQELETSDYLVRSTEFAYTESSIASFITSVTQSGYVRQPNQNQPNRYLKKSLPPVDFAYSQVPLPAEFAELPIQEIDVESLENLPIGLDGTNYQWMDLDGEGTSGILTEQAVCLFYKRNLSANQQVKENGKTHTVARFGPTEVVAKKPAAGLGDGAQFLDLAGDGHIDLVQMVGSQRGFYERTEEANWEPFQAFPSWPNVNTRDPNVKFIDLTGDGHADILISDDDVFQWHASLAEEGFGPAERVYQALDEEKGPHLVFADGTESVYLADMSGDGLTDLVRIRNGDVCYWPNLGYGRFGTKVTMDDAPWFDAPDQFNQRRIRLVDIDGSGTTDILYLHRDGVHIYFNQSGNSWSASVELQQFPAINDLTSVQALDLLGNGTGCLVWSSALPGDVRRPMRYIALMTEKPHLLVGVKNNLGAETTIEYAPSTKFYLDDKQNGTPWITRQPFPVHCVRRVSVYDKWREATFTTTYSYHHGHFDGVEREFRGFGRVDQIDIEDYGQFSMGNPGSPYITDDQKLYQPPIKTVTWFHTGIFIHEKSVLSHYSDEYWPRWFEALSPDTPDVLGGFQENALPEPDFANIDLTPDAIRQALRACKGMLLRQEIYELDVKSLERGEEIPVKLFSTAYHNCHIDRLQLQGINQHAVFLVTESEAITYHYELDLRSAQVKPDPRVAHTLNLTIDSMGHVLQAVAVAYPRFNTATASGLPEIAQQLAAAVQNELHVAYTEAFFTDDIDEADSSGNYRLRLPCEVQTYELTGIRPDDAEDHITPDPRDNVYFSIDEFRKFRLSERYQPAHEYPDLTDVHALAYHEIATAGPEKRLIEHAITLYFDEAGSTTPLTTPMPFGHHGPRGLKYEDYKLALTTDLLNRTFNRGTDDLLTYELETGRTARNILNEPRTQGSPYLKSGYIPGQAVRGSFTDQYWMRSGTAGFASHAPQHFFLPELYRDPFGNDTTLTYHEPDYLFIQASTDARGNTTQVDTFDFRVLAPREMVDTNANHTEVVFDILGRVVAMAVKGKGNEADNLSGYNDDVCNPTLAEVKNLFELPSLSTEDTRQRFSPMLLHATTRFLYHFGEEIQNGKTVWATRPAGACAIQREIHAAQPNGANSPLQIALECSDGSGGVLMKKVQAEPDPERSDPKPPLRWIVNGLTVLNNKGKPVKQYEPAFSERFGCETPQANGVTPVMYYDAPGRLIRTEFPDGTLSRVEFSPWYVKTFDQNDTVLESHWYIDRGSPSPTAAEPVDADERAAWLTTHHVDTPALTVLDSLGREVISVAHNRTPDENGVWQDAYYLTYTKLDAEGKPLWIRDALGHLVMQYITPAKANNDPGNDLPYRIDPATGTRIYSIPCYDIAGNLLFQHSMDAGDRWMLMDAIGKPLLAWDFNERQQNNNLVEEKRLYFTEYDALHRPTAQWLRIDNGPRQMVERFEYRDTGQPNDAPNPNAAQDKAANLIGQAVFHYDPSGRVELVTRDFKGNVLDVKRRLNNQPTQSMINWESTPESLINRGRNPESFLEDETFVQHTEYDALNRMIRLENWHRQGNAGAVYSPTYSARGLLTKETITIRGNATTAIKAIHYNAKGQKEFLELGNNTLTQYDYDPKTFRLKQIRTTRPTDPANFPALRANLSNPNIVQQLLYTYDPVGNITEVEDQAYKPVFFANGIAEPKSLYAYDALYRLIKASGRETAVGGDAARDAKEPAYGNGFPITDQTLRRYTESYDYDPVGNILTLQHSVTDDSANSWVRHYAYAFDNLTQLPTSNRLWQTWTGGDRLNATTYQHDTHGNMLNLVNTTPNFYMRWDHRDMISSINLGGGGTAYYQYDTGKQRTRKCITNQNNLGGYWERIYLSGYELYRRYNGNGTTPVEEIESHHLFEGEQRILLVDDVIKASDATHPRPDGLKVLEQTLFRYEYSNHLGSACLELDDQRRIISYEEYHPYGTSAYRAMNNSIEAPPKRYRYTGMERDEESGLGYYHARYHMSAISRWLSVDPYPPKAELNNYAFVGNQPINNREIDGSDYGDFAEGFAPHFAKSFAEGLILTAIVAAAGPVSIPTILVVGMVAAAVVSTGARVVQIKEQQRVGLIDEPEADKRIGGTVGDFFGSIMSGAVFRSPPLNPSTGGVAITMSVSVEQRLLAQSVTILAANAISGSPQGGSSGSKEQKSSSQPSPPEVELKPGDLHPATGKPVLGKLKYPDSVASEIKPGNPKLDEEIRAAKLSTKQTLQAPPTVTLENPGTHDPSQRSTGSPLANYVRGKSVMPPVPEQVRLFEASLPGRVQEGHIPKRGAVDAQGRVHQFHPSGPNNYHWAGQEGGRTSTGEDVDFSKEIAAYFKRLRGTYLGD